MPLLTEAYLRGKAGMQKAASEKALFEGVRKAMAEPKSYDVFLSHSRLDADVVLGLRNSLSELGFSAYVDWIEDAQMDRSKVTAETAAVLRERMQACDCLYFALSANAEESRWMPWECGYFDGLKQKVAICPIATSDLSLNEYKGVEYLGLYPYVTRDLKQGTQEKVLWVNANATTYVDFDSWLKKGKAPYKHSS